MNIIKHGLAGRIRAGKGLTILSDIAVLSMGHVG